MTDIGDDQRTKLSVSTQMTSTAAGVLGPLAMAGAQGQRRKSGGNRTGGTAGRSGGGGSNDDAQTTLTTATGMTSSSAAVLGPLVGGGVGRGRAPNSGAQSNDLRALRASANAAGRPPDDAQTTMTNATGMTSAAAATLGPLVGGMGRGRAGGSGSASSSSAPRSNAGQGADDTQTTMTAKTGMTSAAAATLGPLMMSSSVPQGRQGVELAARDRRHMEGVTSLASAPPPPPEEDNPLMDEYDRPEEEQALLQRSKNGTTTHLEDLEQEGDAPAERWQTKYGSANDGWLGWVALFLCSVGMVGFIFTCAMPTIHEHMEENAPNTTTTQAPPSTVVTTHTARATAPPTTFAPQTTPQSTYAPQTTPQTTFAPRATAPRTTLAPQTTSAPKTTVSTTALPTTSHAALEPVMAPPTPLRPTPAPAPLNCRVSPWSEWSACEPACGRGKKTRFRRQDLGDAKVNPCADIPLSQKAICFGETCTGPCVVGVWSQWADCSSTCGEGQRERQRIPLGYPRKYAPRNCPALVEKGQCRSVTPCSRPCTGKLVDHAVPHIALQSLRDCSGLSSYQSCSFTCATGFVASAPLLCLDGVFNFAGAQCEDASCDEAPVVQHSTDLTACAGSASGATCTITCKPGYVKSRDATCNQGRWSAVVCQVLRCQKELPRILHAVEATVQCATWALQVAPGSPCPDFQCEPGFRATGTLHCEEGNWVLPECVEEPCLKPPEIRDGLFLERCANQPAGAFCEFQCPAGKLRTAAAVCSHGHWSNAQCVNPSCARGNSADCPDGAHPCQSAPSISVNGKAFVLTSCAHVNAGGVCKATKSCADGMEAVGRLVCDDGRWVGEPQCQAVRCKGPPIVENSADLGVCIGLPSGSVCSISCLPGYVRVQDAVCKSGKFEGGKCEPLQCTVTPVVAHGVVDETRCARMALWNSCPFHCHDGYVPEGELRCLGSVANGARCLPAPCQSPPNVAFSAFGGDLEACAGAPSGTVCTVHCIPGYVKAGDAVCSLGKWSDTRCTPVACGEPPPISNAEMESLSRCIGTPSAETCGFLTCKDGFMKSTELICTQGYFNVPRCVTTSCQAPPRSVAHAANVDCSSRGAVKTCNIECSEHRVKSGNVVCAGGQWRQAHCLDAKYAALGEAATTRIVFTIKKGKMSDFLQMAAQVTAGVEAVAGVSPGRARMRRVALAPDHRLIVDVEIWPPAPRGTETGQRRLEEESLSDAKEHADEALHSAERRLRPTRAAVSRLQGWAQMLSTHIAGAEAQSPVAVELLGFVAGRPCLQVPQVLHGVGLETCAPMLSGNICALQCASGFRPTADLICSNGDWEQSTAECEAIACSEVPKVEHAYGLDACRGYPSGAVCRVLCQPGFQGTGKFLCDRGNWVGSAACLPEPCMAAPTILRSAPLNACAGMPSGKRCQPLCEAGHSSTHSDGILCRNGNWRYHSAPACMPTGCYTVPAVSHSKEALNSCVGTPEHHRCNFDCDVGFKPVGVLMCVQGVWTKPACVPLKCMAVPEVPAGLDLRYCVGTASGRTCKVLCPDGREPTGDLLCLRGVWQNEGAVRCNIPGQASASCWRPPSLADAETSHCAGTQSGDFCDPCIPGYQLDGPLQCTAGAWSEAYCIPQPCGEIPRELRFHAKHWAMCRGTAATGGCALQCEPGFSAGGTDGRLTTFRVADYTRSDELMRAGFHCGQGGRFTGPTCKPSPCQSYPALAHTADLTQCIGTSDRGVCDATCKTGFEIVGISTATSSSATCSRGLWQRGSARCEEAVCGLPPGHAQTDPARRCKGTKSQHFCDFDCTMGLSLASPLLCRQGHWLAGGGAKEDFTCRGFCTKTPAVGHIMADLQHCTPMEAGGYCPITCKAGYVASGSLLCDPETLEWNLVTCGDPNMQTRMEVSQSFQVAGLQARDEAECRVVAQSLLRGLARLLRLSTHLMDLVLEPHAGRFPPAPTGRAKLPFFSSAPQPEVVQLRASLRIFCEEHLCEYVLHRLHLAGRKPRVFDAAMADSVCKDRCIPPDALQTAAAAAVAGQRQQVPSAIAAQDWDRGPSAAARKECLRQCPEASGKLQTIYRREPVIMATELR